METCDILIIDDEVVVADAVVKVCGGEGLSAEAAHSGREGLKRIRQCHYRLVLCDIMMEDLDGFEILAEIERQGGGPVVIMVTGYATVENAVRSLAQGAADFLPKPFTADELIAVVRRGLALWDARGRELGFVGCPADYYRLGSISWVKLEAKGTALLGICDAFVKTLGGILSIEMSHVGEELAQGLSCAEVTSTDGSIHRILCPLSGKILEKNGEVVASPSLMEKDPYFRGWLYRIIPSLLENDLANLTSCSSDRL